MFSRIYLEITNCCNLSCAFCPGTRRARRMLPAEEFRLLAGKLRPWTDYLYLHVLGEPLLHPQLAEILASAGELGFRVCLVTNGTLLAQRLDTLLAAPALHKPQRLAPQLRGQRRAHAAGDVSRRGLGRLCAARGARRALRAAALERGRAGGEERGDPPLSGAALRTAHRGHPRRPAQEPHLAAKPVFRARGKIDWPAPGAPRGAWSSATGCGGSLAVLCDGTVVPCCLDGEGELALGNLFRQELEDILRGERAAAIHAGFDARRPGGGALPPLRLCGTLHERMTEGFMAQETEILTRLSAPLLRWYDENRRVLPWREEVSAYRTWVSEIMLQQTRVAAVLPYFERFMAALPDVAALAAAEPTG